MNNNKDLKFVLFVIILGCILIGTRMQPARAQANDLTLELMLPNEGETFYAGPSSMLYMIPVSGVVKSEAFSPEQISLEVAIYQDAALVTSLKVIPELTGAFRIFANVNPGAYTQVFNAEYITCGDVCHFNPAFQFQRDDWIASIDLPPGPVQFVVTATDPSGKIVHVARNITVDRSNYAIVPVKVELVGGTAQSLENIPITGTTWLYMWRSRSATGGTDVNGLASVKVEALAQAPTKYRFQIVPSVIKGVLYESVAPVEIVLPPGALEGPPVTLQVRTKMGTVSGQFNGIIPFSQVKIWLIEGSSGEARTASLSSSGSFIFENIPISEYTITADSDFLAAQGFELAGERIDLSQDLSPAVNLNPAPLAGYSCEGAVMDNVGNKLPFAQLSIEKLDRARRVMPDTGKFGLHGLPRGVITLVADAPGYYSQAQAIDPSSDECAGIDFKLVRRPDTRSLPWGDGEIAVSPETNFSLSGQHLFFERGWLWGQNHKDSLFTIQMGQMEISLFQGMFVMEDIPGQLAWFYLLEGNGTIDFNDGERVTPILAGQIIYLNQNAPFSVIPYDSIVMDTLSRNKRLTIATIFQPTLKAQISNRLAMLGINFAKLVTFITYMAILLSSIMIPLIVIIQWRRLQIRTKKTEMRYMK